MKDVSVRTTPSQLSYLTAKWQFLLLLSTCVALFQSGVLYTVYSGATSNGEYTHGFLGLFLAGYFFWQRRQDFRFQPTSVLFYGFYVLSALILVISQWLHLQQLGVLSALFILLTLFYVCYGAQGLEHHYREWLILALSLPMWHPLLVLTQALAAEVTWAITTFMPGVTKEGVLFVTQNGVFEVAKACSGLGFILVSSVLALFLSLRDDLSVKRTLSLLAIFIAVAIIANAIRISIIIAVGHFIGMDNWIVHDHLVFGWVLFAVIIFICLPFYPYQKNTHTKKIASTKHSGASRIESHDHHWRMWTLGMVALSVILTWSDWQNSVSPSQAHFLKTPGSTNPVFASLPAPSWFESQNDLPSYTQTIKKQWLEVDTNPVYYHATALKKQDAEYDLHALLNTLSAKRLVHDTPISELDCEACPFTMHYFKGRQGQTVYLLGWLDVRSQQLTSHDDIRLHALTHALIPQRFAPTLHLMTFTSNKEASLVATEFTHQLSLLHKEPVTL